MYCGLSCGTGQRCLDSNWKGGPCGRITGAYWRIGNDDEGVRDEFGNWVVNPPHVVDLDMFQKRGEEWEDDELDDDDDADEMGDEEEVVDAVGQVKERCVEERDVDGIMIEGHYFRVNHGAPWDVTGNLTHAFNHGVAYKDLSKRVLEHEIWGEDLSIRRPEN